MKNTTVIVGAGISGLLIGRRLADLGARVMIVEKSRGVGGRMATKRVGDAMFDHGAQYFTTRDARFSALVDDWARNQWVLPWPGGDGRRWIAQPSMTSIAKHLAEGLDLEREWKVTAARRHACGCWELDIEDHGIVRAERLVLTCPVPQSLALLSQGGFVLPASVRESLQTIRYEPCLAVLLTLDRPSPLSPVGLAWEEGPIRWMADNVKKGLPARVPGAVTVHASKTFSALHYGKTEAEIFDLLIPTARAQLGEVQITSATLHRWRFAEPVCTFPEPCVWLPELGLGFAGDGFGGPRVEGAALSGLALGDALAACLLPPTGD